MKKLIKKHEQKLRFLFAGGWNTLFGFAAFTALYYTFHTKIHYMFIFIISNFISIANAYISYKFFVFKTRGNYLMEYVRFNMVYGVSTVSGMILLPICVELLHIHPVLAQGVLIIFTVIISYIGHKQYSFKTTVSL